MECAQVEGRWRKILTIPLEVQGGVRGGQRSLVGGKQDVQCPARHRGLGGRTLGGEFEMSDIPSNLALPSATAKLSVFLPNLDP